MSQGQLMIDLIRDGERVLRTPAPHDREKQWRSWQKKVTGIMDKMPEMKTLGIQLKLESLASDVGIISRFARLLSNQGQFNQERYKGKLNQDLKATDKKVKIFVSHKHEDERTARGVKSAIERYGAGLVEVFLSEDIPKGANWIDWIRDRLSEADMLLLLFTDASRSWDWCLYEAGLFTELSDLKRRPVICMHSASSPAPPPLRHLQTVPANEKEVTLFLKQLFVEAKLQGITIPLNPALAEQPEELQRAAREIVKLVSRKLVRTDFFSKYLSINIMNPGNDEIDPDSKVCSDSSTLEIFGLKDGEWTWGRIVAQAQKDQDHRWLQEVTRAVRLATEGNLFEPIQASFRAHHGGKRYRPILYRMDNLADGSHVFKLLFCDEVSWQMAEIPKPIGILSTALRMAVRFRYEVLMKFRGRVAAMRRRLGNKDGMVELQQALTNIEMEALSRGITDDEQLLSIFAKEDEKREIETMFDKWRSMRGILLDPPRSEHEDVDEILQEWLQMNQRFIFLGSRRFSELIAEEHSL